MGDREGNTETHWKLVVGPIYWSLLQRAGVTEAWITPQRHPRGECPQVAVAQLGGG